MPEYMFRSDDSGVVFRLDISKERMNEILADGKLRTKSKLTGKIVTATPLGYEPRKGIVPKNQTYPMVSGAMGVNPIQIPQMMADAKAKGLQGVSFKDNGDIVFSDARARREYVRDFGGYDRNGGYGDP
jgi:hypothetical protein